MIDRKKDCWFGSEPEDIAEWLRSWLEDEELDVKPVACGGCGKDVFELEVDSTEGGAQVRCAACGAGADRLPELRRKDVSGARGV